MGLKDRDRRWEGTSLAFGIVAFAILIGFCVALAGSTAGEIAAALGGIIGGAIGAGGAALAVILTFQNQRIEESEKAYASILCEIGEFSRFVVGHLGACLLIKNGALAFPVRKLAALTAMPEPVIYPAIADHISRLPNPTLVVSFYARLEEMKGVVRVIQGMPMSETPISPDHIMGLVDLLISICQISEILLESDTRPVFDDHGLSDLVRAKFLATLKQQLDLAKKDFPDAESFSGWNEELKMDD